MYKLLPIILLLTGCQLYGGLSVHDTSFDSEYKEDSTIGFFGVSHEFNKNFEGGIEHESMPFFSENNNGRGGGYGINKVYGKVRYKLF